MSTDRHSQTPRIPTVPWVIPCSEEQGGISVAPASHRLIATVGRVIAHSCHSLKPWFFRADLHQYQMLSSHGKSLLSLSPSSSTLSVGFHCDVWDTPRTDDSSPRVPTFMGYDRLTVEQNQSSMVPATRSLVGFCGRDDRASFRAIFSHIISAAEPRFHERGSPVTVRLCSPLALDTIAFLRSKRPNVR